MSEETDNNARPTGLLYTEGRLRKSRVGLLAGLLALAAAVLTFVVTWLWRRRAMEASARQLRAEQAPPPAGLSEAEAAARFNPEQDNIIAGKPAISRQQIIRSTIFNIFNLNLVLLGTIQIVFVRPLDGLITLSIIIVNVAANVFQYELAQRRLKAIQAEARPQVTVMRDGRARSVDPREIVVGDVLTVGSGDQIVADGPLVGEGTLLVDESMLGNGRGSARKRAGDLLFAGSICLSGRAAYRADVLGEERQVIRHLQSLPEPEIELTTIEKLLNRVMRFLLVMMIVLTLFSLLRAFRWDLLGALTEETADPLVVILNLAPASLFFMVLITYISSTADLAKLGALVKQSRSVESLAQLDVLCLAKTGFLTGVGIDLEPITAPEAEDAVAVPRIRQILGDFAHSSGGRSPAMQAVIANFPGTRRKVLENAPYLSAYGWSGLIFADEDLKGMYVLAEPELIDRGSEGQGQDSEQEAAEAEERPSITRSLTAVVRNPLARFRRNNKEEQAPDEAEPVDEAEASTADDVPEPTKKGLFGRLTATVRGAAGSVGSLIRRDAAPVEEAAATAETEEEGHTLIFAYNEDIHSLPVTAAAGQLPEGLRPLCRLRFAERVRPEARDAINLFSQSGVAVKIFTADAPETTAALLREAGVSLQEDPQLTAVDAPQFANLDPAALVEVVAAHTVFGSLSPQRSADLVRALPQAGFSVGMAGHGVNDIAALRAADLAIVRKDSSPAVLGLGDLVLLDEDPVTLSRVIEKGQRIVNGLVDILKLYLTQIFYLLLLVVALPLVLRSFPYTSQQAGLINFITLTIPALALTLWASKGKLPRDQLAKTLRNFVAPAALSMAILGFLVYRYVRQQGGTVDQAQNVLTYLLVLMGLLLVVLIKPPIIIRFDSLPQRGDIRPALLVIISAVVFVIITRIPFLAEIFGVAPLQSAAAYRLVVLSALIWVIVVNLSWRFFPAVARVGGAISGGLREVVR